MITFTAIGKELNIGADVDGKERVIQFRNGKYVTDDPVDIKILRAFKKVLSLGITEEEQSETKTPEVKVSKKKTSK